MRELVFFRYGSIYKDFTDGADLAFRLDLREGETGQLPLDLA
jgi:hypothetical protein